MTLTSDDVALIEAAFRLVWEPFMDEAEMDVATRFAYMGGGVVELHDVLERAGFDAGTIKCPARP